MTISQAYELTLADLTSNLLNEASKDFSKIKIKDLSLDQLEYLLRQQMWLAPLIRICIQKIMDNWDKIQIYYPRKPISEWFENIAKELILLPKSIWNLDPVSFNKFCLILKDNRARIIKLEKTILIKFMNYEPKDLIWHDKAYHFFQNHIRSHHGEVLKAIKLIQDFVIGINNQAKVYYDRNYKKMRIDNLEDLEYLILEELEEDKDELIPWLIKEQKIDYD